MDFEYKRESGPQTHFGPIRICVQIISFVIIPWTEFQWNKSRLFQVEYWNNQHPTDSEIETRVSIEGRACVVGTWDQLTSLSQFRVLLNCSNFYGLRPKFPLACSQQHRSPKQLFEPRGLKQSLWVGRSYFHEASMIIARVLSICKTTRSSGMFLTIHVSQKYNSIYSTWNIKFKIFHFTMLGSFVFWRNRITMDEAPHRLRMEQHAPNLQQF